VDVVDVVDVDGDGDGLGDRDGEGDGEGEGDGDGLGDADGDADADAEGDADLECDADGEGEALGGLDVYTDGENGALVGWDDGLAEGDACLEADGEVDTTEVAGTADLGAVGEVVCAAGWNCSGVCAVVAVTARTVPPDARRAATITHASTRGRDMRRRARPFPPGGG